MDEDLRGRLRPHQHDPLQQIGVHFDDRGGGCYWWVELPGGRAPGGHEPRGAEFGCGDAVTPRWYEPGEPNRPEGSVIVPTLEDLVRIEGATDGRVLVQWHTGCWRRWEWIVDLRHDEAHRDGHDQSVCE